MDDNQPDLPGLPDWVKSLGLPPQAAAAIDRVSTYERLVELAGGNELAARMLSLYRPPGFIAGCSQAAWTRDTPVLVRNYDYPASRLEGIVYLTRWGAHRVIGMSDCLSGLLDGARARSSGQSTRAPSGPSSASATYAPCSTT